MTRQRVVWVSSDWHLWQENICDWGGRPKDFTDRIIANCKYYIQPQDTLIHLGDVIFKHHDRLKSVMDSFPGTKILVRGNHDKETDSWYCRRGFSFVCDNLMIGNILLSHKPTDIRLRPDVKFNGHGHTHNNPKERWEKEILEFYDNTRHKLLAMEYVDYKPVCFQSFFKL